MEALVKYGGFYIKIHGGMFQRAGIPDIIGVRKGRFIAIEVKTPDNRAGPWKNGVTRLQDKFLLILKKHGARCGIAKNEKEAIKIVKGRSSYAGGGRNERTR